MVCFVQIEKSRFNPAMPGTSASAILIIVF